MTMFSAIILGLIQGLTEFLPVSSSAHLVFLPALLKLPATPLVFDVSLHLATLVAVVYYFAEDIAAIFKGLWKGEKVYFRIVYLLILGTIPAVAAGLILKPVFDKLKYPPLAAVFLLITGFILWFSERIANQNKQYPDLSWLEAFAIGCGQAFGIAPGISRSGATIAAGIRCGLSRKQAARFSFLLAIPVILGAGVVEFKELFSLSHQEISPVHIAAGVITAGISGYFAIKYFLRFLEKKPLYIFSYYCWGAGLIFLGYWFFK